MPRGSGSRRSREILDRVRPAAGDDRLRQHEGDDWLAYPEMMGTTQRAIRGVLAILAIMAAVALFALLLSVVEVRGGILDWTPDPDDDPCTQIEAPR